MPKNMTPWALATLLLLSAAGQAQPQTASEWPSFGYDQQRSGWNTAETMLSPANVGHLKLLWSAQLPTPPEDTAAFHPHRAAGGERRGNPARPQEPGLHRRH